jgi:hypothetical protein
MVWGYTSELIIYTSEYFSVSYHLISRGKAGAVGLNLYAPAFGLLTQESLPGEQLLS